MKKSFFGVLLVFLFLAGCSSGGKGDDRVAAQVNNYKMTADDLRYELGNVPYDEVDSLNTEKGRKRYLGNLFEKEVLLQEAQRQGLDRESDFMKSIESYWEQALLKLLLQKKSKEISSSVRVYDSEIESYYANSGEKAPLSKVSADIREALKQKKETEAMDMWINELKNKSSIKVNEVLIKEIFSEKR
ncbi:MAG: hypothetical protein WC569_06265 [Candidatus Omnitrophota bacterium]